MEPGEYAIDELLRRVDEIDIDQIGISNEIQTIGIVKGAFGTYLNFNKDFFEEKKEKVIELIKKVIERYKKSNIKLQSDLIITDDIINEISKNTNIEEVTLKNNNINSPYALKKEHYLRLKEAGKKNIITLAISEELSENFDPIIQYNRNKNLFDYYTYSDFQKNSVFFMSDIPKDKLYVLKYLGDNTVVNLEGKMNIGDILKTLKEYNKHNKIKIKIHDQEFLKKELLEAGLLHTDGTFDENIGNNITLILDIVSNKEIPLEDFLSHEALLYSIANVAKDYSPLEKYIYAYDIVKRFKEYRTPRKDNKNLETFPYHVINEIKQKSRDLHQILDNDYIVCRGFSIFLIDLLNKLGIPNIDQMVYVDLSGYKATSQLKIPAEEWEKLSPEEQHKKIVEQQSFIPKTDYEAHSRILVHLVDEKYGVNGLFSSDPTWDNSLTENDYSHMLMTEEEVSQSLSKIKLSQDFTLFFARDMNEFNQMLNKVIDILIAKKSNELEEKKQEAISSGKEISKDDYKVDELLEFFTFFRNFLEKFSSLFPSESKRIKEKYPCLLEDKFGIDSIYNLGPALTNAIYEIGNVIIENNNNKVSNEQLRPAIESVYADVYEGGLREEELDSMFETTEKSRIMENGVQTR